jgi:hypothetical protein
MLFANDVCTGAGHHYGRKRFQSRKILHDGIIVSLFHF